MFFFIIADAFLQAMSKTRVELALDHCHATNGYYAKLLKLKSEAGRIDALIKQNDAEGHEILSHIIELRKEACTIKKCTDTSLLTKVIGLEHEYSSLEARIRVYYAEVSKINAALEVLHAEIRHAGSCRPPAF